MNKIIFRAKPKASKEALYGMDEIKQFTNAAQQIGLKTLGDVEDFLKRDNKGKDILTALYDYLNDELENLDFVAKEDTVKQGNKWVNKGKEGTHGEFDTKKEADAQRRAMFANK